jgi:hypothetical protein
METLQITDKANQVINLVKNAVSNSITGVSFFSIKNYQNKQGEISNNLINIGINYAKSKQQDIEFLENINLKDHTFKSPIDLIEDARLDLIVSFLSPDENRSKGQTEAYTTIFSGVKVHNTTGLLYVYGYRVNKTVIKEGEYKEVKSNPKTIAKNELRKLLKTSKFTQYSIEIGNTIKAIGETIEL